MRFISRSARYRCFPIGAEDDIGNGRPKKRGIVAAFTQGIPIEEWEYAAAKKSFHFPGGNLEDDGDTGGPPVDPLGRVSVYDTDREAKEKGWSKALKEEIEQNMLAMPDHGQDFIVIVKPPVEKPWNSYDDFTAPSKIVEFAELGGISIADVIAYERENKNRKSVIDALESAETPTVVNA